MLILLLIFIVCVTLIIPQDEKAKYHDLTRRDK